MVLQCFVYLQPVSFIGYREFRIEAVVSSFGTRVRAGDGYFQGGAGGDDDLAKQCRVLADDLVDPGAGIGYFRSLGYFP